MRRKIFRLYFYLIKYFIGLLVYLDGRIYMKAYNWLLSQTEMKIEGTPRFISKSVKFDDFDKISIGDRLVVSMNVYFLTHDYSFTTALISVDKAPETDIGVIREIKVGNNVFIGMNSILLPGTNIGNHVIIGAGSVVRGLVEDYSIIAGNPASVVGDTRKHANKVISRNNQNLRVDKK